MTGRGFREWGDELRNWGRWGPDDQLGTLNWLTPERRRAGAREVVRGVAVPLGLDFSADGPQPAGAERRNPLLITTRTGEAAPAPGGFVHTDDLVVMHTQCATQVDALAHVGYDGQLYGGRPLSSVSATGAAVLGIENMRAGVLGRGVLADVAAYRGVPRLGGSTGIGPVELEQCLARQGTSIEEGDVLVVRTGWISLVTRDGDREAFFAQEPGLTLEATRWLHDRRISFLAADNWGVEAVAPGPAEETMPVHCVLVRDMGMPLGEMFDLEELAAACAREGRWTFQFSCQPLPLRGGVGSPVAPVAIL